MSDLTMNEASASLLGSCPKCPPQLDQTARQIADQYRQRYPQPARPIFFANYAISLESVIEGECS